MFFFSRKNRTNKILERRYPSMPRIPRRLASLIITLSYCCQRTLLCASKKVSRCFLIRGSYTVEAAVVLPLFLLAALPLVSVIDICRIQTEQQTQLCQQVKSLAMYAYGVSEEDYIDLAEVEPCKLPVSLLPGYTIPVALRGRVHAWTGRSDIECEMDGNAADEEMVYVSEYESVYHTSSECSHLNLSIYEVGAGELSECRNASGGKYDSCEKCCGTHTGTGNYYICPTGSAYHSSLQCSGLQRSVRLVRRADVPELSVCTRCGGS